MHGIVAVPFWDYSYPRVWSSGRLSFLLVFQNRGLVEAKRLHTFVLFLCRKDPAVLLATENKMASEIYDQNGKRIGTVLSPFDIARRRLGKLLIIVFAGAILYYLYKNVGNMIKADNPKEIIANIIALVMFLAVLLGGFGILKWIIAIIAGGWKGSFKRINLFWRVCIILCIICLPVIIITILTA